MSVLIDKDMFPLKMQLSKEDATFNAENVESNTTQRVQSVGSVEKNRVTLEKPLDFISRQFTIESLGEEPEVWTDSEGEIATRSQWRIDKRVVETVPSADVRENIKGEWIRIYDGNYKCSNCGDWWGWDGTGDNEMIQDFKFCPNCGCDMRERSGNG